MKYFLIGFILGALLFGWHTSSEYVVRQTQVIYKNEFDSKIKSIQKEFNIPAHTAKAIVFAADNAHLDPRLIAALAKSESNFDMNATADNGHYFGAMQIPYQTNCEYANYAIGAYILSQKLKHTHGNLKKAIALYKGGLNRTAFKQSNRFWKIYNHTF